MTTQLRITNVPAFSLEASALRLVVDKIADHAMTGLEKVAQAMGSVPAELQPLLNELRALFCTIGHTADATSDDVGIYLDQVWSVDVVRAGNHELVAANSPTIDEPEVA
jgi:hypothetical protein